MDAARRAAGSPQSSLQHSVCAFVEQNDDEEEWDTLPAGVGARSSDDEPWALVGDMPPGEAPCTFSLKQSVCERR